MVAVSVISVFCQSSLSGVLVCAPGEEATFWWDRDLFEMCEGGASIQGVTELAILNDS